MTNKVYTNRISQYAGENGGRVLVLFLLFALAIYEFIHAGFNAYAVICLSPLAIVLIYAAFKWKMGAFWLLIVVNWFIMSRNFSVPFPKSLADELLELLLIAVALIDIRETAYFGRAWNFMLFAIMIWFGLCTIEIFNDTCGVGLNVNLAENPVASVALGLSKIIKDDQYKALASEDE